MTIITGVTSSFLGELATNIHVIGTDQYMCALYTSLASLNPVSLSTYITGEEVSGDNYTAGGVNVTVTIDTTTYDWPVFDISNAVFTNWAGTSRGAVVYNSDKANRSFLILDFGQDYAFPGGTTIVFPTITSLDTAIVRMIGTVG